MELVFELREQRGWKLNPIIPPANDSTWKLQACNIWDDPPDTCGLLQVATSNRWIAQPLYVTKCANTSALLHFHGWDSTCFHNLTGYSLPKCLLTFLNFALSRQRFHPAKAVGLLGSFGLDAALPRVLDRIEHKTGW